MKNLGNLAWHSFAVTRADRALLNRHRSVAIWFTGLSGAGKSTLANALEKRLHQIGMKTFVLDGDNVRHGLCNDIGFSDVDRSENIRRVGEVSRLFVEAGVIVIAAFIAPFHEDRVKVRSMFGDGDFHEIYCECPIEICESRDVKGLYRRARAGEIENFTGVSSRFEKPCSSDLIIDTCSLSISASVGLIVDHLLRKGVIDEQRVSFREVDVDASDNF